MEAWHIEFLRPGEFQTFTDLQRAWTFVQAANAEAGTTFFQILVDAAHCGDSHLDIPANEALIERIGAAGELGCFAFTEKGAGVLSGAGVETTAEYDPAADEFVIHSPTPSAAKNWISQGL